jgi:dihydroorotate dehydrogenase
MVAGAQAVQVGTASFVDPRACARIAREMVTFAAARDIPHLADFNAVV